MWSQAAFILGDILYAHIKYITLDANTEARIGLNTNAGSGGNTLLIIGSYQWDGGTNTASFIDMVKFPYSGNSFVKTEIANINRTDSVHPIYDEYYGDFVIKAKCATRVAVIYSRLSEYQYID